MLRMEGAAERTKDRVVSETQETVTSLLSMATVLMIALAQRQIGHRPWVWV